MEPHRRHDLGAMSARGPRILLAIQLTWLKIFSFSSPRDPRGAESSQGHGCERLLLRVSRQRRAAHAPRVRHPASEDCSCAASVLCAGLLGGRTGSRTRNSEPPPTSLSTVTVPPTNASSRFTI